MTYDEACAAVSRLPIGEGSPIRTWLVDRIDVEEAEFLERRRSGGVLPLTWARAMVRNGKGAAEPVRFVEVEPVPLRMDVRMGGNGRVVVYHRDSLDAVRRLAGFAPEVPAKDAGWLDRKEVQAALGGRTAANDALFRDLERAYEDLERGGAGTVTIERSGGGIRVSRRASTKTAKPVCYHAESLDAIRRTLGISDPAPQKGPGDLNYKELANRLGVHASLNIDLRAIRDAVQAEFDATGRAAIDGIPVTVGYRRNGPRVGLCWSEDSVEVVRASIARRKAERLGGPAEETDAPEEPARRFG